MAFIRIDRDIVDHWVYKDAEYFKVWFEMLHRARYVKEPGTELIEGQLIEINYAEFVFGRKKWSDRLGISEQRLRTLLKKLVDDGMIEPTSRFNKFSLYRIKNYEKYNQQTNQQTNQQETKSHQGISDISNQQNNLQDNQQSTNSQPAANQQLTTKEESKESKEGEEGKKELKKKNGRKKASDLDHLKSNYAEFVRLTTEQYKKLVEEHGEHAVHEMIEILNSYKASTGRKYDSDYHTMTGRGWVLERYRKETLSARPRRRESSFEVLQRMMRESEGNGPRGRVEVNHDMFG